VFAIYSAPSLYGKESELESREPRLRNYNSIDYEYLIFCCHRSCPFLLAADTHVADQVNNDNIRGSLLPLEPNLAGQSSRRRAEPVRSPLV
jgi:hypothetical protein